MVSSVLIQRLKQAIAVYPDFPKEGISFKDIMPVLADPGLFADVVESFCEMPSIRDSEAIVGIDARGFILASAIALRCRKPLLAARKPGKLPGLLLNKSYDLEYGRGELAMQTELTANFNSFAIVDDLLATGGTANAAVQIIKDLNKPVLGVCVLVELAALGGVDCVDARVESILKY